MSLHRHLPLALLLAAALVFAGSLARDRLLFHSRQRLSQQYVEQLASLSETEAARLIRRLAQHDDQWLEVIVAAACDDRPEVSLVGERQLRELVERWSLLTAEESSPRCAELARLLATRARELPAECRQFVHALAQRLIVWPVDSRQVDAARFIADCQSVLMLPIVEPTELRVAAAPPPPVVEPEPDQQEPGRLEIRGEVEL